MRSQDWDIQGMSGDLAKQKPVPRDPKPQPTRADWKRILGRELIDALRKKNSAY